MLLAREGTLPHDPSREQRREPASGPRPMLQNMHYTTQRQGPPSQWYKKHLLGAHPVRYFCTNYPSFTLPERSPPSRPESTPSPAPKSTQHKTKAVTFTSSTHVTCIVPKKKQYCPYKCVGQNKQHNNFHYIHHEVSGWPSWSTMHKHDPRVAVELLASNMRGNMFPWSIKGGDRQTKTKTDTEMAT